MDHPAALHRLTVGVPATVEHSSEATDGGSETGKWVAETTQVSTASKGDYTRGGEGELMVLVIHHVYGRVEAQPKGERPASSVLDGTYEWVFQVQGESRMGRQSENITLVRRSRTILRKVLMGQVDRVESDEG